MSDESPTIDDSPENTAPPPPPWARATLNDVTQVDFEELVRSLDSADAAELGDLYRRALPDTQPEPETPTFRVYSMKPLMLDLVLAALPSPDWVVHPPKAEAHAA